MSFVLRFSLSLTGTLQSMSLVSVYESIHPEPCFSCERVTVHTSIGVIEICKRFQIPSILGELNSSIGMVCKYALLSRPDGIQSLVVMTKFIVGKFEKYLFRQSSPPNDLLSC